MMASASDQSVVMTRIASLIDGVFAVSIIAIRLEVELADNLNRTAALRTGLRFRRLDDIESFYSKL